MASQTKGDERGVERCAHSDQDRTNGSPAPSLRPLDGGDGREPGVLGEWKAVGLDIDGNPAVQA